MHEPTHHRCQDCVITTQAAECRAVGPHTVRFDAFFRIEPASTLEESWQQFLPARFETREAALDHALLTARRCIDLQLGVFPFSLWRGAPTAAVSYAVAARLIGLRGAAERAGRGAPRPARTRARR